MNSFKNVKFCLAVEGRGNTVLYTVQIIRNWEYFDVHVQEKTIRNSEYCTVWCSERQFAISQLGILYCTRVLLRISEYCIVQGKTLRSSEYCFVQGRHYAYLNTVL